MGRKAAEAAQKVAEEAKRVAEVAHKALVDRLEKPTALVKQRADELEQCTRALDAADPKRYTPKWGIQEFLALAKTGIIPGYNPAYCPLCPSNATKLFFDNPYRPTCHNMGCLLEDQCDDDRRRLAAGRRLANLRLAKLLARM